jgi:Fur family ferric uptake transcriptional regulator
MPYEKEYRLFEDYISHKNLRPSKQRKEILNIFLKSERHLTADELYRMVKKKYPSIGYATIYRTLKLFCESGLSRELRSDDGITRYEHLYGHEHHDHLICIKCGKFVEVVEPDIERLQENLAKRCGFTFQRHRMEIYGICKKCRNIKS